MRLKDKILSLEFIVELLVVVLVEVGGGVSCGR